MSGSSRQVFRTLAALALIACAVTVLVGCGSTASTSSSTDSAAQQNGPSFVKTRIAIRLGLAAGAANHWIIDPAQSGGFAKGATGRKRTIAKALLAGAFVAYQAKKANALASKDPKLRNLSAKISAMVSRFGGLSTLIAAGRVSDFSRFTGAQSSISDVLAAGAKRGMDISENSPSAFQLLKPSSAGN